MKLGYTREGKNSLLWPVMIIWILYMTWIMTQVLNCIAGDGEGFGTMLGLTYFTEILEWSTFRMRVCYLTDFPGWNKNIFISCFWVCTLHQTCHRAENNRRNTPDFVDLYQEFSQSTAGKIYNIQQKIITAKILETK